MNEISSLTRKPLEYYNIDGIGELSIGFMCLGYALLGWLQSHSPEHSFWNQMYTLFLFVGVMCAIIHYGSRAIKNRITYPRTGYVEYRKQDTTWKPAVIGMVFAALLAAGAAIAMRRHWDLSAPGALVGLLFAATYAFGIARTVWWKWAVVAAMTCGSFVLALIPARVLGSLIAGSPVNRHYPAPLLTMLMTTTLYGCLLTVSGGISFWLYLHHTQTPEPEAR